MRLLPQTWWGQLLLVLGATVGLVAGLYLLVTRAAGHAAAAVAPVSEPRQRAARPALPFRLAPVRGTILLVEAPSAMPAAAGQHLVVHADGRAELLLGPAVPAPALHAAAIQLPGPLPALPPAARTTLLDLLQQLVAERPVPAARVVRSGAHAPRELSVLLAWVP